MLGGNKLLRIALIGPPRAGKTSFVSSALHQYSRETHIPTLFEVHTGKPWYAPNGQFYQVHLYDCGGFGFTSDSINKIGDMDPRWKEADGIFVCFAINELESWKEACFLVENVLNDKHFDSKPKFLVATKGDLASERKITTEEANQYAQSKKMLYFSTSAANNTNTTELLDKACDTIFPTLPVLNLGPPSKKGLSSSDAKKMGSSDASTPRKMGSSDASTPRKMGSSDAATSPRGGDEGGSTPRRKGSIFKMSSSSSKGKDSKTDVKDVKPSKGSTKELKKIHEDAPVDKKDDKYSELEESATPRDPPASTPRKEKESKDKDKKSDKDSAPKKSASKTLSEEPKKSRSKSSDKDKDSELKKSKSKNK